MEISNLCEIAGGALQEQFEKAFIKVVENMMDINTPYKAKRSITIKLDFVQNEMRDDVQCSISVKESLAAPGIQTTAFCIGKDLKTGEIFTSEYGKQIKGQMSFNDYETEEDEENSVVDFRKAK